MCWFAMLLALGSVLYMQGSNLAAPLGHTGRRVVLGHTLNTQTLTKTKKVS